MAPMGTTRDACASVLLGDYVYIFGGDDTITSVVGYSIVGNAWEDLPILTLHFF